MLSVTPPRQTVRPLRFVRWSRRSSATFHSIGREVTIGHLAGNVVERLSLKSTRGTSVTRDGILFRHDTKTEDEEGLHERACLLSLSEAIMLPTVPSVTAEGGSTGLIHTL